MVVKPSALSVAATEGLSTTPVSQAALKAQTALLGASFRDMLAGQQSDDDSAAGSKIASSIGKARDAKSKVSASISEKASNAISALIQLPGAQNVATKLLPSLGQLSSSLAQNSSAAAASASASDSNSTSTTLATVKKDVLASIAAGLGAAKSALSSTLSANSAVAVDKAADAQKATSGPTAVAWTAEQLNTFASVLKSELPIPEKLGTPVGKPANTAPEKPVTAADNAAPEQVDTAPAKAQTAPAPQATTSALPAASAAVHLELQKDEISSGETTAASPSNPAPRELAFSGKISANANGTQTNTQTSAPQSNARADEKSDEKPDDKSDDKKDDTPASVQAQSDVAKEAPAIAFPALVTSARTETASPADSKSAVSQTSPAPDVNEPEMAANGTAAVRDVRVQFESDAGGRAEVRIQEVAGQMQVSVHSDPALSQALRDNLPELKAQLQNNDMQADLWHPEGVSRSAQTSDSSFTNDSGSSGGHTSSQQEPSGGAPDKGTDSQGGARQQYQPDWLEQLAQQASKQKTRGKS